MAEVTLFAEDENIKYSADCIGKRGDSMKVEVYASTSIGARTRVVTSAKNYDIKKVGTVRRVGPREWADKIEKV